MIPEISEHHNISPLITKNFQLKNGSYKTQNMHQFSNNLNVVEKVGLYNDDTFNINN